MTASPDTSVRNGGLRDLTLEQVVTGRGYADLPASPLQRAICRAAQGLPLDGVIDADACERHFGTATLPPVKPVLVELVAGVRAGKSFLAACAAIHAALTADLSGLKPHELPRFPIIGPRVDAARATFVLLLGILQSSAVLSAFVDGEPTADTVVLRRPDGRRVEIVVVAAARGGVTVRNRWLAGFVLEEVASFGTEGDGAVVNAEDVRGAAETRLLPGCQGWLISSPFGPSGLLYDLYQQHFGKPGRVLVVHAPTRALNPSFPQETIDAIAASNPDLAAREYGAEWVDADTAFLAAALVDKAMRAAPLCRGGRATAAAMDPATRANSWTLACAWAEDIKPDEWWRHDRPADRKRVVVGGVWQWQGSKARPLNPREVLAEISATLAPYRLNTIYTDQWSYDALSALAQDAGLRLMQPSFTPSATLSASAERDAPYHRLKTLVNTGDLELPPQAVMRGDLLAIRQRASSGSTRIHLPRTPNGRHADFAPSVALAAYHAKVRSSVWEGRRNFSTGI